MTKKQRLALLPYEVSSRNAHCCDFFQRAVSALQSQPQANTKSAMRQRLRRTALCAGGQGHSGRTCQRTDCQAQRVARLQGRAQALDRRAGLCLAGEEPQRLWKNCERLSIPACSSSISHFRLYYWEDREQAPSPAPVKS